MVQSTAVNTPVTVYNKTGTSTVNVGTPGNLLRNIVTLTVTGGTDGITSVNLNDQGNADGPYPGRPATLQTRPTYVITEHSVIRSDAESTVVATINFSNLAGLTLNGGTTHNIFNVQSTAAGTPVVINAGISTDMVNVGDSNNTMDGLRGPLTLNGRRNTVLNVNDPGTTADKTYSLTHTTLTRTAYPLLADAGGENITFSGLASLVLHGGSGNNLFGVTGTSAGTAVTIYGGTANSDQLVVGDDSSLDSVKGPLTFHGQTAYSFAVFNDLVNAAVQTYTLGVNKLQRTGMADIRFDGLDQLALYGGTGKDIFNVESTLAATPVSIVANGGDDTFNVSPIAHNLGNIAGSVDLAALGGADTLNLYDQATSTAAAGYIISAASVSRPGMAPVTFASIENVSIYTKLGKLLVLK